MEARRKGNVRRVKKDRRYFDRRAEEERRRLPADHLVRKILVTGDREWDDIPRVLEELKGFRPGTILVHGACRGADIICAAMAEALGFVVRGYPADWEKHRRAAGPIRNRQMLKEEHKPEEPIDLVLAFHNNIENSSGTADMIDCVIKAGIPWKLNTSHPCSSAESERQPAKLEDGGSSPPGCAPAPLTEEEAKKLLDEGKELQDGLAKGIDDMHRLNPEDLLARCK